MRNICDSARVSYLDTPPPPFAITNQTVATTQFAKFNNSILKGLRF